MNPFLYNIFDLFGKSKFKFTRAHENPILTPISRNKWESKAVFNPATIYLNGKVHILYRAMSEDNTSTIGYATSKNGIQIDYRAKSPVYIPREQFELKKVSNFNSGCEDPRLSIFEDKIYMLYTAYDGKTPGVALTSITKENFLNQKWIWSKPVIISPSKLHDKDAALFPEKINGKYVIIHRLKHNMDLSFHSDLNFKSGQKLEEYKWIIPRKGMWDSVKVGLNSPPIKIKEGWLIIYHGVSKHRKYRLGAVLVDHNDPTKIIHRTKEPIFEPETGYEKVGMVPNVVFPCGAVVIGDKLFIYYGGADKVAGVAYIEIEKISKYYAQI
jgi:beta-1,2-mannobiose phosphorylase / 1,2-beta-oligomannan phosphorylase